MYIQAVRDALATLRRASLREPEEGASETIQAFRTLDAAGLFRKVDAARPDPHAEDLRPDGNRGLTLRSAYDQLGAAVDRRLSDD